MNFIYSVIFDVKYKPLETKTLKLLKIPLFLGFLKYISEEEVSEEELLKYIELNKNKVQNVWVYEYIKISKRTKECN